MAYIMKNSGNPFSSELIINNDGSVYHLGISKEDLADEIILTGDPGRVGLVSAMFDTIEVRKEKREFVTHTGKVGDKRITVMSTGMGTDNIDIVLNELDILANYNLKEKKRNEEICFLNLYRLGTSGGINPLVEVGEMVLGTYAIGLDNLIFFYEGYEGFLPEELDAFCRENIPALPRPYMAGADNLLASRFKDFAREGITLTAPGFYGPQGRNVILNAEYPDIFNRLLYFDYHGLRILNMEMESSAMYALSQLMGHRAVTVCAVLANRMSGKYSHEPEKIIRRMIEKCLEAIAGHDL